MRARALATVGTAIALVLATAGAAGAASWHFETLDGQSSTGGRVLKDVGQFTSTVIYAGTPHTFYRNVQDGSLRHAWWTGSRWEYETLDGAAGRSGDGDDIGTDVKAVIFAGTPHVFYYDVTNRDLRHAWWTGSTWAFETLDGKTNGDVGTDISVVLFDNGPHVFYFDATNGDLRHGWWNGARWSFETLDGDVAGTSGRVSGTVGQYTSTVIFAGTPHVFYYDDTQTVLRHAWWTGWGWAYENLDGTGRAGQIDTSVGSDVAAIVYAGTPHVWYYDIDHGNLRHAWWTGSRWAYETLDGDVATANRVPDDVGTYNSVLLFDGTPHVFYRNETATTLRHAWWTGSSWAYETLDGAAGGVSRTVGDVGLDGSAVIFQGQPHVLYYDHSGSGDLRHAWYS